MKIAGQVALALAAGSALVAAPGFGYDAVRLPVVLAAATVLAAVGAARQEPDQSAPRWAAWAAAAFVATHALSWIAAIDFAAAVLATAPAVAGLALFLAVSRGWVATDHLFRFIGATALAVGAIALLRHPASTLGNPNYAGCACAILGVLSLAGAVEGGC